jgi:hypothetical protein
MEKTMADNTDDKHFKTADIKFAAFLKAAQVPFVDCVDEDGGKRKVFLFEVTPGLRPLRRQFFARQPDSLASLTLFNEYDALKSLIYD